ncbi:jerky protein homolog-like [Neodiprion pinetum]|uniref:jerky protein homolog-like n=1 Tax=Neodiprion pinetum TaxID=441929 RepID=UPI001EDCA749|nr:jerky protein homolog-like [Neodiprion pinetum]
MTETLKKRKRSDCSVRVEENVTESPPQSDINLNKEVAVTKRNRYTFEEKKKILEECKTLNSRELCAKYGLNKSVLSKWRSNEEIIKNAAKTSHSKTLKKVSEKNELDAELFTWLSDCRCKGIAVSGPMLCRQALVINSRIGGPENFKAIHGWLEKWKRRTHIKNLQITGEKLSADVEAANMYKAEFAEMVARKKLERSQVFNMDESGLVYKSTPKRTFVAADQAQAAGGKKQLERVTIATCSNADGSFMLPLILIGKSKNPRCLRNVNKDELPVWYCSQTNAWINKEIFEEWFTDVFVPKVESFLNSKNLPKTAVLLVDNCRSHRYVKINDIEVNFFPPNVTSLIQPMDQGIIQTVKLHYEINLVNAIVEAQNENVTLIEFLKTIDVHKVIFWIADAWKKVKPTTIQKCWKNLWPKEIRDASTQTDEDSFIIDNLDMSVGTDVTVKSLTADDRDVIELLNLMKKVDGYEDVDATTVSNWIQKTEKQETVDISEGSSSMEEFDCLENIRPSAECVVEQNDTQQDENDSHYVSESFAVLYENL